MSTSVGIPPSRASYMDPGKGAQIVEAYEMIAAELKTGGRFEQIDLAISLNDMGRLRWEACAWKSLNDSSPVSRLHTDPREAVREVLGGDPRGVARPTFVEETPVTRWREEAQRPWQPDDGTDTRG